MQSNLSPRPRLVALALALILVALAPAPAALQLAPETSSPTSSAAVSTGAGAAAPWPTEWHAAPLRDHESRPAFRDPSHGLSHDFPGFLDIASGAYTRDGVTHNPGPDASLASSTSAPGHVHLAMRLQDDPRAHGGIAAYRHGHWAFYLDLDGNGLPEFAVDLFGGAPHTGAGTGYKSAALTLYNTRSCTAAPTGDLRTDLAFDAAASRVWSAPATAKDNGYTRVREVAGGNGAGTQYLLEVAIPRAAFASLHEGCTVDLPTEGPLTLFATTGSATTSPLQRDWAGSSIPLPPAGGDGVEGSNGSSSVGTPGASPALTLQAGVDRASAEPGDLLTYTLTYGNTGGTTASASLLRALLPGGLAPETVAPAATLADGALTWELGTLASGATGQVSFTVRVPAALAPGVYELATGASLESTSVTAPLEAVSPTTLIRSHLEMALALAAPAEARPGDTMAITLVAHNLGNTDAAGATLTLTLPGHATLGAATGAPAHDPAAGTLTWALGTLARAERLEHRVTLIVDSPMPAGATPLTLSGALSHAWLTAPVEATATTLVSALPLPTLAVETDPATARANDSVLVTVRYANVGDSSATQTRITLALPAGLTPDEGSATEWDLGTLAPGAEGLLTVPARVTGTPRAGAWPVPVRATLASPDLAAPVEAATELVIEAAANLQLTQSALTNVVYPGELTGYFLAYANTGDGTATGARLHLPLPPGLVFLSADKGGVYDPATRTVQWHVGDLAPGATGNATFFAKGQDPHPGLFLVCSEPVLTSADTLPLHGARVCLPFPKPGLANDIQALAVTTPYVTALPLSALGPAAPGSPVVTQAVRSTGRGYDGMQGNTTHVAHPAIGSVLVDDWYAATLNTSRYVQAGAGTTLENIRIHAPDGSLLLTARSVRTTAYATAFGYGSAVSADRPDVLGLVVAGNVIDAPKANQVIPFTGGRVILREVLVHTTQGDNHVEGTVFTAAMQATAIRIVFDDPDLADIVIGRAYAEASFGADYLGPQG